MSATPRIVIAEDEENYREVLSMLLEDLDADIVFAEHGVEALELVHAAPTHLVVTDLNMPQMGGLELMERLRALPAPPPVVVVTAYGSVDVAVDAMRKGAIDFLEKPFDADRLLITLERAMRHSALVEENQRLRETLEERYDFAQIHGTSEALLGALKIAGKVAQSDATVLVRGESGTGKELFARAIHFNSPRKAGPFVAVNCAAIPEALLEAELFGAEAGAYTGATKKRKGRVESAQGGTLFLDEIGDMPVSLQSKLLRLLQERTFMPLGGEKEHHADVRFVFATHQDLEQATREGRFREDLYYRVSVVPVTLPPLRDRGDDVLLLAETFASAAGEKMGKRRPVLTEAAKRRLASHPFPGNVRELANVIERAVILAEDDTLDVEDLALASPPARQVEVSTSPAAAAGKMILPAEGISLEEVERSLVEQALERTQGNKSQAARLLGLSRATLRYRIEKLGLAP